MRVFLKKTDTEVLETLKYLGVTTDKDLDWKEHGHSVYKKAEFMFSKETKIGRAHV